MNLRLPTLLIQKLSPERLFVLVIALGLSFGAVVLVPGLKLASELVETSAALKWVGEQQRYTTVIRASLETMRDRLTDRGYIQESLDQLKDSSRKLDEAVISMTAPRAAGWFSAIGLLGRRRAVHCRASRATPGAGVGQGEGGARSGDRIRRTSLCGQRIVRQRAERSGAGPRAQSHGRDPHQPPLVAGTRRAVGRGGQRAAGGQRAGCQAAANRDAPRTAHCGRSGGAHHAAAQCAQATGCEAARGATADRRHPAHREGGSVSARRESGHRKRLFGRPGDLVPTQGHRGAGVRCVAGGHRLGEDPDHRAEVRQGALGRAHQREAGEVHQSARRSGGASDGGPGQSRHAVSRFRVSSRARRWQDHPRSGVRVRRELPGGAGPGAAELPAAGAGPGRYAARHPADRSQSSLFLPERFECGDEDDQCRPQGAGPRGERVPQETRYAVPAGALRQGRGRVHWGCRRSKAALICSRTI